MRDTLPTLIVALLAVVGVGALTWVMLQALMGLWGFAQVGVLFLTALGGAS